MIGELILNGALLARVSVECSEGQCQGEVLELSSNAEMHAIFMEYEHAVRSQLLVDVDRLEETINSLAIEFATNDGAGRRVKDLQLYPDQRGVSFDLTACFATLDSL